MARGHKLRGQSFEFSVDFGELERMLDMLPKAMSKTVLRNALKKSAKPIRDAAAAAAPKGPTGNLAKSITVSTQRASGRYYGRRARAKRSAIVFVGATAPHAWLVEHGTGPREVKDKSVLKSKHTGEFFGPEVGEMPPQPFFRNAWDATKSRALQILVKEIENELLKAAKRLRTRAEAGTLGKAATKALS